MRGVIVLRDEIEIAAPPERVFAFLADLPAHYLAWHPDHVSCRWARGTELVEGSRVACEELLHGDLHHLTFTATRVVPDRLIAYSLPIGDGSFETAPSNGGTRFVATLRLGSRVPVVGGLVDTVLTRWFGDRLLAMRRHMAEEGANLERLLMGPVPPPVAGVSVRQAGT